MKTIEQESKKRFVKPDVSLIFLSHCDIIATSTEPESSPPPSDPYETPIYTKQIH